MTRLELAIKQASEFANERDALRAEGIKKEKWITQLEKEVDLLSDRAKAKDAQIASLKAEVARLTAWCPDECPVSGRPFFMWIEHPDKGMVPTYGGPYDSYTIPERIFEGKDVDLIWDRYDHDLGAWKESEISGLKVVSETEIFHAEEMLEKAQAEVARLRQDGPIAVGDEATIRTYGGGKVTGKVTSLCCVVSTASGFNYTVGYDAILSPDGTPIQ